ncbi:C-type lectin lectoxin-Phi2-like isoform X2 [Haliotis rufescens]|uniref:C-type lectin lectoxin-Phi2-like isoform X2 n=1 Tax=Haliotis rufescens TaxID=6454 RepID=UPI00201FB274|nr:C-type lectin lectoxin-Phi2-like isoform X2 [Haliotis rufescens]
MQPSIQQMLVACWVLHWHHNPVFCTAPWKGTGEIACQQIKELAAGCSINPHVTLCPTDAKKGRTVKKKRYKGYKTIRAANETIRVKISWIIKTWHDASGRCEEDGGFLAVLNTDTRRNVVKRIVGAHAFTLEKAWIGLRDVHGNNTFVWVDGTPLVNWKKRIVKATPTNVLRKQTCVAVLIGHRLRMGTSMCDKKLPFLCQI